MRRPLFFSFLVVFFFVVWKIDSNFSFLFRREVKCCRNVHRKLITLETQLRPLACFGSKKVFWCFYCQCVFENLTHVILRNVWVSRECWETMSWLSFWPRCMTFNDKNSFCHVLEKKPLRFFFMSTSSKSYYISQIIKCPFKWCISSFVVCVCACLSIWAVLFCHFLFSFLCRKT